MFYRGGLLSKQLHQIVNNHFRLGDIGIASQVGNPVFFQITLGRLGDFIGDGSLFEFIFLQSAVMGTYLLARLFLFLSLGAHRV